MSARDEIQALQWTVPTRLGFSEVVQQADEVFAAKELPASKMQRALTVGGTFRTAMQAGVSVDYQIVKTLPTGYGLVRISYQAGEEPRVRYQIIDGNLKRQKLTIILIPIPVSPWYAPAMAEFRDTSARLRRRVEAR